MGFGVLDKAAGEFHHSLVRLWLADLREVQTQLFFSCSFVVRYVAGQRRLAILAASLRLAFFVRDPGKPGLY